MKTMAAVLWGINQKWEVEEVDLDGPKEAEVLVKMTASGLCHSDYHVVTGDLPAPLPMVGGHEGAGVVVEVGPGVKEVAEGDHVVMSFLPSCGHCKPCARGMSNLCDLGAYLMTGTQLDGTVALDKVALLGCGVTTGFGSVVRTGEARAGDTVVVMGIGGVGINAV